MRTALLVPIALLLASCGHPRPEFYSISDYPDSIQPRLVRAANVGYFDPSDSAITYFDTHVSDSQIILLSRAEIPLLRAIALHEIAVRPGYNHQAIMMAHLDDTAVVPYGHDPSRLGLRSGIEYMLDYAVWKNESGRDSFVDELLLHHDNLQAAYDALRLTPSLPKYYSHIRRMAMQQRPFRYDIETALVALAKYKKNEDIPLIKATLMENERSFSRLSFDLMLNYPDSAYLDVLTGYYLYWFNESLCYKHPSYAEDYINTLAAYKADTAAKILANIISTNQFAKCYPSADYYVWQAKYAIYNNPCPAYKRLLRWITPQIIEQNRLDSIRFSSTDTSHFQATLKDFTMDTTKGPVSWRDP